MDPYQTLGVPKDATDEQIQESARKLARKYHPDREGGDPEKMAEVNVARDILLSPEARAKYDRTGQAGGFKSSPEEQARQMVLAAFAMALQAGNERTDFIDTMREGLETTIANQRQQIKDVEKERAKVERFRKRLKGGALFDDVFAGRLADCDHTEEQAKDKIKLVELAMNLLDGYSMPSDSHYVSQSYDLRGLAAAMRESPGGHFKW